MKISQHDNLLAYKVIVFLDGLTRSEILVGCGLLDHFNRKTGLCCPSHPTLAAELDIDESSVKRSIKRLSTEPFCLFRVTRHGGRSGTNQYTPIWHRFNELLEERPNIWKKRKKANCRSTVTYEGVLASPDAGCVDDLQTQLINSNKKPKEGGENATPELGNEKKGIEDKKKPVIKANSKISKARHSNSVFSAYSNYTMSSKDVASEAAKKRIDEAFRVIGGAVYAAYTDHTTSELLEQAAVEEAKKRGLGVPFIVRNLLAKGCLIKGRN